MIRLAIVTAGGLGHLKPAPGTWGSLPAVALGALLLIVAPDEAWWWLLVLAAVASALCVRLTPWAHRHFDREDPGEVVIDEVAGMALALGCSPLALLQVEPDGGQQVGWLVACVLIAFIWFRVFDIAKPPPIDLMQRMPDGWGVLLDDLVAGVAAAGATWGTLALAGLPWV